jgi:hypothetical protein
MTGDQYVGRFNSFVQSHLPPVGAPTAAAASSVNNNTNSVAGDTSTEGGACPAFFVGRPRLRYVLFKPLRWRDPFAPLTRAPAKSGSRSSVLSPGDNAGVFSLAT